MSFSRAGATATWLIAVALHAATKVEGTADESAAAHRAMCRLYRAAAGTWTAPTLEPTAESTRLLINAVNMSVAPQTWQDLFTDDDSSNAYDTLKDHAKELADKLGGKAAWDAWRLDKKNIKTLKIGTDDSGNYKKIRDKAQAAECSRQIQVLVSQAQTLADKEKPLTEFLTDDSKNKIKTYLNAALYGGTGNLGKPEPGKTTGDTFSFGAACKTSNPRLSIAGDFFCLCGHSSANNGECSKEYTPTSTSVSAAAMATDWETLRATCGVTLPQTATAEAISSALTNCEAALTQKTDGGNARVYLGHSAANTGEDCDGSDTKTCVSYTKYFVKNSGQPLATLPWYKALSDAASAITEARQKESELRAILHQLAAVESAVRITYNAAAAGRLAITAPQQNQPKKQSTEIAEECHKHHDDNTTCPKDKCIYDEKANKCNPIKQVEGSETTATGKGGATNAEAKKCSNNKTQEECKSPNCKWEGETCKDTSFLVNKKFVLTVATLVILVAF
uniref:Variant surface glycoprotein 1125.4306 n=1 Tax=Trypanosoma brucei TaxID=5691 RepID=A0A1J0RAP1_9TRYP|nr:variant surface glycoprotein 1125.4306 [Trypanosoma brucei]